MHANVSKKHFLGSCHNFWDKSRAGRFQRRVETLKIPQKRMSCQCQRSCLSWPYFQQIWKYMEIFKRYRKYYEIIGHGVWADQLVKQILEPKKIQPWCWASSKDNLGPEHSGARDLRPKFDSRSAWRMAFVMAWRTKRMSSLPLGTLDAVPSVHVLSAIPSHAVHQSTCMHCAAKSYIVSK